MGSNANLYQRQNAHLGFAQIRERNAVEEIFELYLNLREWLVDIAHAFVVLHTLTPFAIYDAIDDAERAFDNFDDLRHRDLSGRQREHVTAVCALNARDDSGLYQLLQNLRHDRFGDFEAVRDLARRANFSGFEILHVLQGDEAVFGFASELEHMTRH